MPMLSLWRWRDNYPARVPARTDRKYGLGLEVERLRDGTRRLWHDGSNRGWQAHLEVFPDRDGAP
jgi:hypothetical protein